MLMVSHLQAQYLTRITRGSGHLEPVRPPELGGLNWEDCFQHREERAGVPSSHAWRPGQRRVGIPSGVV